MISWIITSSVLILIIIVLRYLLRGRISLRLQYALWLIVLIRLLLPFGLGSSPVSLTGVVERMPVVQDIESIRQVDDIEYMQGGTVEGYTGLLSDEVVHVADNKTPEEFIRMKTALKLRDVAMPLWKLGEAVFLLIFLWGNLNLGNELKKSRSWFPAAGQLPVYITDKVETPCLFGLFIPTIYMTSEAASDETVLRHTLEHELTHYYHRDNLWAVLRCIAVAFHWYNPLVWWAAKLSRDDAELACDEATILRLGEDQRADYGRTLIEMTCSGRPSLLTTATTMTGSKATLKERVQLIAKKPKMAVYTLVAVVVIAVLAAVLTLAGPVKDPGHKFHQWLTDITVSDIEYAQASSGNGMDQISYDFNEKSKAELVSILNSIDPGALSISDDVGFEKSYELRLYETDGELSDGDSFYFRIQDDSRIAMSFSSKNHRRFTDNKGTLWIESPELVSFISSLVDEHGFSLHEAKEITRADLDYDGEDEIIRVDMKYSGEVYTLQVLKQDGTVIWEGDAALPHLGWTTYMLYQDGTSRGILNYTPAVGQGLAGYNYQVHFLDGRETPEFLKDEVSFPIPQREGDPIFADYEYDPAEVIAFLEDINNLMEHSTILLSTEGGELIVGSQSPQQFIDNNMELIRHFSGQEQITFTVAEEMKKVKASDITELGFFSFTADDIASALNSAADNQMTAGEASGRGFSSDDSLFWEEIAYLEDSYETGVSGATLSFRMKCGLAENIVKVTYGTYNNYSTGFFESEKLYNLLRYRDQAKYGEIDQAAFDKFQYILTNQMDHFFSVMSEAQRQIYSYELIEFNKAWSFEESDGATVELYNFDYGLLVNDPEKIQFAGGMRLDGWLRLRGFNGGGQLAVRYRDGEMTAYSFMGNDFWYDPAHSDDASWAKERLKSALDHAETPPMYDEAEIQDAIQVATKYFDRNFKGCTLRSMEYGGDDMSKAHIDWAVRNDADEVIVLVSAFRTDSRGGDGSLNPDTTYHDWKWILVRTDGGKWKHVDHGY